jgi:hypothetical protein
MVFREIIVICFQNHTHNTLCGENAEFVNVKAGSIYAHHCTLKSYNKLYTPLNMCVA